MKSYSSHLRSFRQATIVAALSLGLSACSMFDFLGLGGEEEAAPTAEGVEIHQPKEETPEASTPIKVEKTPVEFVAPPVQVESKDASAQRLLQSIRAAKQAEDGKTLHRDLIALRDLGEERYPTLFAAYQEAFDLSAESVISYSDYRKRQNRLGIESMLEFVSGPLYSYALADEAGNTPKMLIVSALRALASDPTLEAHERFDLAKGIAFANLNNRRLVEAAIWSQEQRSLNYRTKLATEILQTPGVGPEVCTGAIDSLNGKIEGNLLLRLEALERSPNLELSDAARYAMQRGQPCAAGFLISRVRAGSMALQAGLRRGDIVTSVGDQTILSGLDWSRSMAKVEPNGKVTLAICRSGKDMKVELTTTSRRHGIDGNFVSGK